MRALVVYESMFGNTKTIAKAVADGLSSRMSVDLVEVNEAPPAIGDDVDVLVVGGPTHAFGMSRAGTRKGAGEQGAPVNVSGGIGLREWIEAVEGGPALVGAAAFDTAFKKARLMGTAARAAEKRLRRLGVRLVAKPESFWVSGTPGPLVVGEEERARRWGAELAAAFSTILSGTERERAPS